MERAREIAPSLSVLPSLFPVPVLGTVPVNAYLVRGEQPYLVDTGILAEGEAFLSELERLIDPSELEWIFLTHDDADHIGALHALLERAPRAKLVTNFLGLGKLGLFRPVMPQRVRLLNPGERLDLGDRTITAARPPVFDAPETTVFHDSRLDALFCADCFGCALEEVPPSANDLPDQTLLEAQLLWATLDSPWIHAVDRSRFHFSVAEVARNDPAWILSAHLPPAHQMTGQLCRNLWQAPEHVQFIGPSQDAFETLLTAP